MRDKFVSTLLYLAKIDPNIHLITGDLGFGVLKPFWEQLPDQFINAGIAEQSMTGIAAGMAMEDKKVVTYSIGNFPTLRCLEQIRNDCAYHDANVKIVCVGGGFVYGSLGMSHHATEDLAVMRALPNVTVFAPGDALEAEAVTKAMLNMPGTCYLRLGRGGEKIIHRFIENFEVGKAITIEDGDDVAIFSCGAILEEAHIARQTLSERGLNVALCSFPTIKPIDEEIIKRYAKKCKLMITIEEHNIMGGFGSAVAEVISSLETHARLIRVGLNDTYSSIVGSQDYLRQTYGINAQKIIEEVERHFSK